MTAHRAPLLTCYFPLGDPLVDERLLDVYAASGVDIVELGVPSRRPYLDGPDVSASMARALSAGGDVPAALARIVAWCAASPGRPRPICMSYADVDTAQLLPATTMAQLYGLLMLDLDGRPDAARLRATLRAGGVRSIRFVSPAATAAEVARACEVDGYVMLQAAAGVTGPRPTLGVHNRHTIARLRAAGVQAPILLGFGIGSPVQAAEAVALGADGVVIGSMCLRKALEGAVPLGDFLRGVRDALDAAAPSSSLSDPE